MKTSLGDWEEVVKVTKITKNDSDLKKYNKSKEQPAAVPWSTEEKLEPANNIIKDVIDTLDNDVSNKHGMNSIDFNTELHEMEVPAMTTLQMLSTLGLGGFECSLLAQRIQRNKVSLHRKGRTEKVEMLKAEREHESASREGSLFGKIKGFMSGKKNE